MMWFVEGIKERRSKQLAFAFVAIAVSALAIYMTARSTYAESGWQGPSVEERIRDIRSSGMPEQAKAMAIARLQGAPPHDPK
jgi:hypothetical protein